jgi:peptide-methionine (R)-S-oxide reductase
MSAAMIDRRNMLGASAAAGIGALLLGRAGQAAVPQFRVSHPAGEWLKLLGPQRYAILRGAGTEPAWSSPLLNEHRKGTFTCAGCALPLFSSATKFESHTGWPSFWQVLPHAVVTRSDTKLLFERTEVLCARCGGHLGHVFDDGPRPTGLRYCMNGLALSFVAA